MGRLCPGVQPLMPFHVPFLAGKAPPFINLLLKKWYPFTYLHCSLKLCIPLLHLALSSLFTDQNDRFPYPFTYFNQRAKKVVSDSPGLVDFAIGLVHFVLNLPHRQVKFFEEFKLQKNCEIYSAH